VPSETKIEIDLFYSYRFEGACFWWPRNPSQAAIGFDDWLRQIGKAEIQADTYS
jgi:hypothetical protein